MRTSAVYCARIGAARFAVRAAFLVGTLLLAGAVTAGAKGKPAGGRGVSHTARQNAPIQLGTSGGWSYDLANGYCCGGTLGALVDIGGTQYILSNWHVFSVDTASGGNGRVAANGDPIIQPGLIDVECRGSAAQTVGDLVLTAPPTTNNVDAAVAAVSAGMVETDGAILEVGPPSNSTVAAAVGQRVKKSGRTTGLTRSAVSGLFARVSVAYEDECAGQAAFTKEYTDQILVRNRGSKFLNAGDSGSLLLEDVDPYPRAVGLLFAGSNLVAVANPIDEVLAALGGATMVGAPAVLGLSTAAPDDYQAAVGRAHAAQLRHAKALEQVPESIGHAVGLGPGGDVVIKVLVAADSPRARAKAPRSLDGVPVEVEVVGRIVAY